nr:O-antigen ligase family protein [Gemmatimonadaceae bacterium]
RRWLAFAVVWVALLLSVTRMTIVACAAQAVLLLLLTRRTLAVGALATLGAGIAAAATIASGAVRDFIWRTVSFQTQSSVSHLADWSEGVVALWEHPVGAGLATADMTAARFGREPLTADNLLFKYAVELGWPGLLAFVVFFTGLLTAGVTLARRGVGEERQGALLTVAVTAGILLNGATAVVTNLPLLTYVWAWLAGATVARERLLPPPRE